MLPNKQLIQFRKDFKEKLFSKILQKYSTSEKAAKIFKVNAVTFRSYKNRYAKSMPLIFIKNLIKLKIITEEEVNKNTIRIFSKSNSIKEILTKGREFRHNTLKKWKNELPNANEIINQNYLDLEKWYRSYKKLIDFGSRKILNEKYVNNKIILKYTAYSRKKKKYFETTLPRKILINKEFLHFFGLWCGDKTGGKRFGISNKNPAINKITEKYMRNLYQNPNFVLYIATKIPLPKNIKFDKVVRIKSKRKGYAVSVHVNKGILTSFFNYLTTNLDTFLKKVSNREIFFAGLFDAEGNVFFEDRCFRWSCENKEQINIYEMYLRKMNLFNRFDGANLITDNIKKFSEKILLYLKHPQKVNDTSLLAYNKGKLNNRFKDILDHIKNNPGKSKKELAKDLKRAKLYSQIKFLDDFGYVKSKGYPEKVFITSEGLRETGGD